MVPRIKIIRPSDSDIRLVDPDEGAFKQGESSLPAQASEDGDEDWDEDERDVEIGSEELDESVGENDWSSDSQESEKGVTWEERMKWVRVYSMHFLFMWNSQTYEYVSIFLVASTFPEGLTATSIRGIASTIFAMLCATAIGNWIDRSPSRLSTFLITIYINHAAILASYLAWLYWPVVAGNGEVTAEGPFSNFSRGSVYVATILLDVVHGLSAIANRLSVERDWVPVLVGTITPETTYGLTQVNSVMARIELICKLVAPLLLPLVVATFRSRAAWIILLAVSTVMIWAVEIWCARVIARKNPELQVPKKPSTDAATLEDLEIEGQYKRLEPGLQSWLKKMYFVMYKDQVVMLKHYFSVPVWSASIADALLRLTVLAYSATFINHLLEIGFEMPSITAARASGIILALSGTVITPAAVGYLRSKREKKLRLLRRGEDDDRDGGEAIIVRTVGVWGILWELLSLIPVVTVLWRLSPPSATEAPTAQGSDSVTKAPPHIFITVILFGFLSMSRVGYFMVHLMVQELGQVEVSPSQRSTFAGTEQSFRSLFELCHWAVSAVCSRPEQFRWLALGSLLVVGVATLLFAFGLGSRVRRIEEGYEGIAMADVERDDNEV